MGSRSAANADRNSARFSCLFPRREGCSPRIDDPERRVTGAQVEHRGMIQMWTDGALQCRMDLREQATMRLLVCVI